MTKEDESQIYVTYKWLIATMISTLVICLAIFSIYTGQIEKKLSKEVYERDYGRLCKDIGDIKDQVDANAKVMDSVRRNQELVLRALKIEPVK